MAHQDEWKAGYTIPSLYSLRVAGSGRTSRGTNSECDAQQRSLADTSVPPYPYNNSSYIPCAVGVLHNNIGSVSLFFTGTFVAWVA